MKVNEAARLKAELTKGKRGRGLRYDPELKKRALVYIRQRRREGAGYKRIGRELGLGFETVRRWSLASAQGSGAKAARRFAPVQIVPEGSS